MKRKQNEDKILKEKWAKKKQNKESEVKERQRRVGKARKYPVSMVQDFVWRLSLSDSRINPLLRVHSKPFSEVLLETGFTSRCKLRTKNWFPEIYWKPKTKLFALFLSFSCRTKVIMQGKLIAIVYTLCTYWNQFRIDTSVFV